MSPQDRRSFLTTTALSAAGLALSHVVEPSNARGAGGPGFVTTSDGYKLRYEEAGSGKPLVCIPGWSQTAAQFKHQLTGLGDRYRVIAVDMRGHGESDKPAHGYSIARLSKDVHDLLADLSLADVTLMGHSMGCSVIWSYWELFGSERLAKLVLVDQMPFITANPAWSAEEKEASGALFDPNSLHERERPRRTRRSEDNRRLHRGDVHPRLFQGRGGVGHQAEPQAAPRVRGAVAVRPRHARLAPHHSPDQHSNSRCGRQGQSGGVPIHVEKEKWRILPVGEVHDQPAALAGGHRRNAP